MSELALKQIAKKDPLKTKVLSLSETELSEIPTELREFQVLEKLKLDFNPLVALPEWIGQLRCLKEISASNCQLTSLPNSLQSLVNLQSLNLESNDERKGVRPPIAGTARRVLCTIGV